MFPIRVLGLMTNNDILPPPDEKAVSFDGDNDYIEFGTNFNSFLTTTSPWAMAAWVKVGNISAASFMFSTGTAGYGIQLKLFFPPTKNK